MRFVFAIVLVAHGLIHALGAAKAFKVAALPQLTQPISPAMGLLWIVAAVVLLGTAVALLGGTRWWWALAAIAIVLSQWAITASWTDAKFGSVLNLVALVGVVFGFLGQGPWSLRAQYDGDVEAGLARTAAATPVTEADLAHLPASVHRYLRASGVVGQPRIQNMRVRMHGRIRGGPDAPWMPFTAEQHNFYDRPSRFFYMNASRSFVPIQVFHRYSGTEATMRVKAAALVSVADASGSEMTRAETVTMFNDMALLAPATLIDPSIAWEPLDAQTARATFTNAGHTIRGDLVFNDAGELTNFWSDDRRQASSDGKALRVLRWSTPFGDHRAFGPIRLGTHGEALWHEPAGAYAYIEIVIDDVRYNVAGR
jgi:hypothetical protein